MTKAQRRMIRIVGCVAAMMMVAMASADTVERIGNERGAALLEVTATSGVPIYGFHMYLTKGRIRSVQTPQGWDAGYVVLANGDRPFAFWTTSAPIDEEPAVFRVKASGKVRGNWQTREAGPVEWPWDGEWIHGGMLPALKGKL